MSEHEHLVSYLPTSDDLKELHLRHLAAYAFRAALRFRAMLLIEHRDQGLLGFAQTFDAGINRLMALSMNQNPSYLYGALRGLDYDMQTRKRMTECLKTRCDFVAFECLEQIIRTGENIQGTIDVVERVRAPGKSHPSLLRAEDGAYEMLAVAHKALSFAVYFFDFQTIPELSKLCSALQSDYDKLILLTKTSNEPGVPIDPSNEGPLSAIWEEQEVHSQAGSLSSDDGILRQWPGRRPRAFLSYASEDSGEAMDLREKLRACGVEVWFDRYELLPGQRWAQTIREAISKCDFFIAFLTENSVTKRGFVQKELKRAIDLLDEFPEDSVFIIPVTCGQTMVPASLDSIHYVAAEEDIACNRIAETMLRVTADKHLSSRPSGDSPS